MTELDGSPRRWWADSGFTLATVFGERAFDTIYLLSISAMALTSFRELPAWLVRGSRLLAVAAAAGVAFAVLLPHLERPLSRLIHLDRSGTMGRKARLSD